MAATEKAQKRLRDGAARNVLKYVPLLEELKVRRKNGGMDE